MMVLFLHTPEYIRIVNEGLTPSEFSCSPDIWYQLEPEYPPLPEGKVLRYWTPRYNYVDGNYRENEEFDGQIYCDKVNMYESLFPTIWVHVTLSQDHIDVNADPPETITFTATIKLTQGGEGDPLPIYETWFIRLRHEDGFSFDNIRSDFVNGVCSYIYEHEPDAPLGNWYLDENDFDQITVGEMSYTVKLAHPVTFNLHRTLQHA
jgi:hypothetical protein